MIHFSKLMELLLDYFSNMDSASREQYFVFINIYGQYVVYQKSIDSRKNYEKDLERVKTDLAHLTDQWLDGVYDPEGNIFAESRIRECLKDNQPVMYNVWIEEVFQQNFYWQYEPTEKLLLTQQHIVSFYSYKGGTGRTTALFLTALAMAQMGKKVVLVDFDLESAGFFRFFSGSQLPNHGVLDYLVESFPYDMSKFTIPMVDYLQPATDLCGIGVDGTIYIVPAYGTELLSRPKDCKRAIMHSDLDLSSFQQSKITPIDYLFSIIHDTVAPDYIFVDSRSGMHQIAGIILNRYSSLSLPFFTADNSNVCGMKLVLPTLKEYGTPYRMIHARMPREKSMAEKKRQGYLEEAYAAMCGADESYSCKTKLDDPLGEHYPFELPDRQELAHVSSLQDLLNAYPYVQEDYEALAKEIIRRLPSHREHGSLLRSELVKREKAKEQAEIEALLAETREKELTEAQEIIRRSAHEQS